ncbi:MAG: hypothetical protein NC314_11330 [Roseburia sp.]|nr:hypothetical protein [Ruminococcus sp.]MCM1154250.1 hypothetical protein [Roseburia sp.]MCM1243423.1 hypothetical protein [Roseburia sp.]
MKKRYYDVLRFALKCILIPAAALLVIYCLNKPYKPINDQKYLDVAKFTMLGYQYTQIQIGNLGSSHGAYNFDYTSYESLGLSCFNFANASQSFDYDYAILKEYGAYMAPGSVMFIPVSYFSFNNEVVNASEAEAMSVRYYHCLSPKNIPGYDPFIDLVTNRLPILSAGEDLAKLFPNMQLSITAYASESEIDVAAFAAKAQDRYSRHFDNKEEYFLPERIENLYDIIDYCKEHDITPVLITTPFSKYYRDLVSDDFLREFEETVTTIADDTGVTYYDYSYDARFRGNLNYFMDADHLNYEGIQYFMQILTEEVAELQKFF